MLRTSSMRDKKNIASHFGLRAARLAMPLTRDRDQPDLPSRCPPVSPRGRPTSLTPTPGHSLALALAIVADTDIVFSNYTNVIHVINKYLIFVILY